MWGPPISTVVHSTISRLIRVFYLCSERLCKPIGYLCSRAHGALYNRCIWRSEGVPRKHSAVPGWNNAFVTLVRNELEASGSFRHEFCRGLVSMSPPG